MIKTCQNQEIKAMKMKSTTLLGLMFSVMILSFGCAKSTTTNYLCPIAQNRDSTSHETEINPDLMYVKVWRCQNGNYVLDDEQCNIGVKWEGNTQTITRPTIRSALNTRYAGKEIVKIIKNNSCSTCSNTFDVYLKCS